MLILRRKVEDHLEKFLDAGDKKHLDLMTDLVWIAAITCEFGFQSPKNKQEKNKKSFFEAIAKTISAKLIQKAESYDYEPCFKYESRFPEHLDQTIVFGTVLNLANAISLEKLMEWLDDAWQLGIHQQKAYGMEVEGGILNEYGIACEFGARLAMDESFMNLAQVA